MSEVNNNTYNSLIGSFNNLTETELAEIEKLAKEFNESIEKIAQKYMNGEYKDTQSLLTDVPELVASMSALSLDTLLSAINDEERRNGVQSAVDSLDAKNDQIQEEGQKKLEQIQKQLEANKSAKKWGIFGKIFKAIGALVGLIASAATIALGVMTANPVLVAAGVFSAISTVDSIVSLCSDGKASISTGITALFKAMGVSEKTAGIIGTVFSAAVTLTGVALSFGAAGVASGAKVAEKISEATSKAALKVLARLSSVSNIVGGVSGVGTGVTGIGTAVETYKANKAEAAKIDIDAILERLRAAANMLNEFIEQQMKAAEELMEDAKEIVDGTAETNTRIMAQTQAPS